MTNRDIDRLLKLLPPSETKVRFAEDYRKFLTPRDSAEILGGFAGELSAGDRQTLAVRVREQCEQISQTLSDAAVFPGSGIARVLVSTDRLGEAFDILERTAPRGSDLDVVQYVEAILAQANLSAADASRLFQIVAAEYERRNQPAGLLLAKAQIQEKTLDFDGAMASYRQLISADEQNAAALNNLAFLLAMRGENPSEAVAFAQRAMALTGPVPAIIDTYAVALISSGKPGQAVELLKSIAADDGLPASHFHQAWAYFKSGDDQAARNAMREAGKRGLRLEALHPLEIPIYEQLRSRGIRLAE
jgi:tetratricopeptide (TPR) repeat protein